MSCDSAIIILNNLLVVELQITSLSDIVRLAMIVESTRVAGATAMNDRSSRSHAVVVLQLTQRHNTTGQVLRSQMQLVDLAGM